MVDLGVREASSTSTIDAFAPALHRWKFKPFLLGGQAMPVCSMILAMHPVMGPATIHFLLPLLDLSTLGVFIALRVSGGPKIMPTEEMLQRISDGYVLSGVVRYCIDATGAVDRAETYASTGVPDYDALALAAIRKWRFRPGLVAGKPVRACGVEFFHSGQPEL